MAAIDFEFHPHNMKREDGFFMSRSCKPKLQNLKERKKPLSGRKSDSFDFNHLEAACLRNLHTQHCSFEVNPVSALSGPAYTSCPINYLAVCFFIF
jgi:hypothetical protein